MKLTFLSLFLTLGMFVAGTSVMAQSPNANVTDPNASHQDPNVNPNVGHSESGASNKPSAWTDPNQPKEKTN